MTRTHKAPHVRLARAVVAACVAAVPLVGCNAIFGIDSLSYDGSSVSSGAAGGTGGHTAHGGGGDGGSGNSGNSGSGGDGGSAGVEDCSDGVDNDGNSLTDCEDPACGAGYVCVPQAVANWVGPAFSRPRLPEQLASGCGTGFVAQTVYSGLTYASLSCACSCGEPSDADCSIINGKLYSSGSCGGLDDPQTYGCWNATQVDSVNGDLSLDSPGTCDPAVTATNLPGVHWSMAIDLCIAESTGAGCGPSSVCSPRPPAGFSIDPCVLGNGNSMCIAEPFTVRTVCGSETIVDGRSCSVTGCTCGAATGQNCSGGLGFFNPSTGCSGNYTPSSFDGTCQNVPSSTTSVWFYKPSSEGGQCAAGGTATVVGAVQAATPYVLCCTDTSSDPAR